MPRTDRYSVPAEWVPEVLDDDGEVVEAGYMIPMYAEVRTFTIEEETAADLDEIEQAEQQIAWQEKVEIQKALTAKLADNTITDGEIRDLLRVERGL